MGNKCRFYHRVPNILDSNACDISRDIFGRERHSSHLEDSGGVGSFNSDSQTLFVADLKFDRSANDTIQRVEQDIWDAFSVWGEIENVRTIPSKAVAFVRFTYRAAAEFAKVALDCQKLGQAPLIRVRWATEDPNPKEKKRRREESTKVADAAVRSWAHKRMSELELATLGLSGGPEAGCVTAPYPDTSIQSVDQQKQEKDGHQQSMDAQNELAANIGRMSEVLDRIDALHRTGEMNAGTL